MSNKVVIQPRKPGQTRPVDLAATEKFLRGASPDDDVQHSNFQPSAILTSPPAAASAASTPPPPARLESRAKRNIRTRKRDGRVVRQTTVYFDVSLSKKLALYCAEHELDQSEVVSAALHRFFESAKP